MAFPNVSDLITTTMESRSGEIADGVTGHNGLLTVLNEQGHIRKFDGGRIIYEEMSFADNGNVQWYDGYDTLTTGASDVLTSAEFNLKQAACPVAVSGREKLQNSGKAQLIDLVSARVDVAEASIKNLISAGLYSDGTANNSKQLTGLLAAVPVDPTTGTYGAINRATASNVFWRSQALDTSAAPSASTIQGFFNTMWARLNRGKDRPNLITTDDGVWAAYMASLQANQRFTDGKLAQLGFSVIKYMSADVICDSGMGGDHTDVTAYFLNTKYLHFRPHKDCNMVPLSPDRSAVNQDASVKILAWAGNLTCSNSQLQGQIVFS